MPLKIKACLPFCFSYAFKRSARSLRGMLRWSIRWNRLAMTPWVGSALPESLLHPLHLGAELEEFIVDMLVAAVDVVEAADVGAPFSSEASENEGC